MQSKDLTKGNVFMVLASLAIPLMASSLLQFTYNLVDMMWVGRLGTDAVASIGASSAFVSLGYAINALVVIGTGIKVSHSIGEQNSEKTKQYINSGIIMNLTIGAIYGLILFLFSKQFIGFLKLNNEIVEQNALYYLWCSVPMLFFAFFNTWCTRIFGSFGNNKMAFKINSVGVIINMILDPIFIYVLNFGVIGAGVATLVSNAVTFALFMKIGKKYVSYQRGVQVHKNNFFEIARLGFPNTFQRVLFTLINIYLARLIAQFGTDAIAAQKIGLQVESITYMVVGGILGAMSSFAGQNYGAKNFERIKEGYKMGLRIGIYYAIFTTLIFWLFPYQIVNLFINEISAVQIAVDYLRIIGLTQIFGATEMVSNGLFTGIGLPKVSATISIVFTFLRLPMAILLIPHFGINGIWYSIALSSALKGTAAFLYYMINHKKLLSTQPA
ncbi:MAG: MATE family efflux transporter [Epulopiscium sp. Nele67-Bin005]|nr:MAG: MATE family efflux transporter [Epulopiscium sp. Nele67-Bin005]